MRSIVFILLTLCSTKISADSINDVNQSIEDGISSFTVKLNKLLHNKAKSEENVLFSPVNIYTVLALLHLGSDGGTRQELSELLGFPAKTTQSAQLHENFSKILKNIQNSRKADIIIADGVFLQNGFPLNDLYRHIATTLYKSDLSLIDFANPKNNATEIINRWISSKTRGRIPTLFTSPLPQDTLLILASSLYFSASWFNQFEVNATKSEKFNTGFRELEIPTMYNKEEIPYSNNPMLQYEAINLQYFSQEISMFIVLPYANQSLKNLVDKLTPEDLRKLIKETTKNYTQVEYKIPKMKFRWSQKMNDELSQLGVKSLFDRPNLNNMIYAPIKVSEINHAAEIEINEKGTVASAFTSIAFVPLSLPQIPPTIIPFYVNRPFMFFIFHFPTKSILFNGLVYKPNDTV